MSLNIEQIELHDWTIDSSMSNSERYQKSVSAYYLNNWYHKVKDITFKTFIYPIDDITNFNLDKLPFDKCMVRYENKSPKDSEYWKACETCDDIKNIFNTSLRCKKNKGKYLCIREWNNNIIGEFRCFWNHQLVAVGDHSTNFELSYFETSNEICNSIINWINTISHLIPYIRCVFDIALIKKDNNLEFKLIEFNSWESNSGALPYDWSLDSEIMYPDFKKDIIPINFRSANGSIDLQIETQNKFPYVLPHNFVNKISDIKGTIMNFPYPCNWLKTDKYLYVTTDLWLVRFDFTNLTNIIWKRVFTDLHQYTNTIII